MCSAYGRGDPDYRESLLDPHWRPKKQEVMGLKSRAAQGSSGSVNIYSVNYTGGGGLNSPAEHVTCKLTRSYIALNFEK